MYWCVRGDWRRADKKRQALIIAGQIFVGGQKIDKAGFAVEESAEIELHGKALAYVSRGGLKLEKALQRFPLDLKGKICIDWRAPPPEALRIACCKMGRPRYTPWMSATDNWPGAAPGPKGDMHGADEREISDCGADC